MKRELQRPSKEMPFREWVALAVWILMLCAGGVFGSLLVSSFGFLMTGGPELLVDVWINNKGGDLFTILAGVVLGFTGGAWGGIFCWAKLMRKTDILDEATINRYCNL